MSAPFQQFPKVRPELPDDIAGIYERHYRENRSGGSPAASIASKMESWLHKKVASDVVHPSVEPVSTLEIGAGTLNQLDYELLAGDYDIVEPFKRLFERSPNLNRLRHVFADIREIPLRPTYDRITAIAAFEHLCDLPEVVARAGILLKPGGVLRVSIPSEGTLLWTLGWKLTTGLEFRLRYSADYSQLMRHEHVNTAREVEEVLTYFFATHNVSVLGLCRALSFYQYHECGHPDLAKCRGYVQIAGRDCDRQG